MAINNCHHQCSHQNHKKNFNKCCNEFLKKGPALILERINVEDNNQVVHFWGYHFENRELWLLAGFILLFLSATSGGVAMLCTTTFDNVIFSKMALVNGSESFDIWRKPSPHPLVKFHIFNYTNVDEVRRGEEAKLNVSEVGPYVYEMSVERFDIKFYNSQLSYREKRAYKFLPELSKPRRQSDKLVVPNIPLLSVAGVNKHASFLARMGVSSFLNGLNAQPFVTLPAHKFIVGYEDNLYELTKSIMKLNQQRPYDTFGLVASSIGENDDVFTINTGEADINRIGNVQKFNGAKQMQHWSTDECNALDGSTDGSIFSPRDVRHKKPLKTFAKEMCRTFPLRFQKEVTILNDKIPAYRYAVPFDVFDSADLTSANQCFCNLDDGTCPHNGLFNITPCAFGAPMFISFPHFYHGDPALREGVNGLDPDPENVESYLDIHPTLGFAMAGQTRLQLNIQVLKSFGISQVNMFEDGVVLPVAWFELVLEDKHLPDDMVGLIFTTTFTVRSIELGFKYGFPLTAVLTLLCIGLILRGARRERMCSSGVI